MQVENALKATPGVLEAAVSLVTHKAEVCSPHTFTLFSLTVCRCSSYLECSSCAASCVSALM